MGSSSGGDRLVVQTRGGGGSSVRDNVVDVFGAAAEGRLRFCYALARETIETALERMAPVLSAKRENREAGA